MAASAGTAGARDVYAEEMARYKRLGTICLALAMPVFMLGMFSVALPRGVRAALEEPWWGHLALGPLLQGVLAAPIQFGVGSRFYRSGYKAVKNGGANMDVLVALGTSAAYFYSLFSLVWGVSRTEFEPQYFFDTSVVLITVVILGKLLETITKGKTAEAIKKLPFLRAKTALLLGTHAGPAADYGADVAAAAADKAQEVPIAMIQVGDVLKGRTLKRESDIQRLASNETTKRTARSARTGRGRGGEAL